MTAPLLLIPGPVQTDPRVKAAMAQDIAPWDNDTRPRYAALRERVRAIAGGIAGTHVCLPLQGCGHFIVEAALRSFVAPGAKVLIPSNGNYGVRMVRLAREAGRVPVVLEIPEGEAVPAALVAKALAEDPAIGVVSVVQSETATALVNPVEEIAAVVRDAGRRLIVDAVSGFGAIPFDLAAHPETDAIVFSSNKCLEAMPGIGFAVARIDRLEACAGNAGSWSFDLSDVYRHALTHGWGSIRFTPSIQALAAFEVALDLFDQEGGQPARLARYSENARVLWEGLTGLGLTPWLARERQGPIIVNMLQPPDPAWDLQRFVALLKRRGFLISNFSTTALPTFRVAAIGRVYPEDMKRAVAAIGETLAEMGVRRREAA
ncbi:2-aminoethylphosphonate--pyruvate transaminase [Elioraea sp.]|uniref:2-aminoethylphosphonate--pyruvate transaminase n=1 Tax=Elioraea sp. TaxID=2185103 RepID=UPI00307FB206